MQEVLEALERWPFQCDVEGSEARLPAPFCTSSDSMEFHAGVALIFANTKKPVKVSGVQALLADYDAACQQVPAGEVAAASGCADGGEECSAAMRLVHDRFVETPLNTHLAGVLHLLMSMNCQIAQTSCCQYHGLLHELSKLIAQMTSQQCLAFGVADDDLCQCPRCFAIKGFRGSGIGDCPCGRHSSSEASKSANGARAMSL